MQPVESSLLSFATSLEKPLSQLQTSVANCIFLPKNILAQQRIFPNFSQKPQGYNLSGIGKITGQIKNIKLQEKTSIQIYFKTHSMLRQCLNCCQLHFSTQKVSWLGNEFSLIFHKNLKVTICLELEKSQVKLRM